MEMQKLYLLVPLAPLVGAIIAGLFCRVIPRWVAHTVTIAGVAIACIASACQRYFESSSLSAAICAS